MTSQGRQSTLQWYRPSTPGPPQSTRRSNVVFLWSFLAVLYLVALISLGMTTYRKGHHLLFWVGIFFPILWIVGALMSPKPRAATAA
jgi:hypothetical protein